MNKVVATLIAAGLALGLNTFALAKTTHHMRHRVTHRHTMRRMSRSHMSKMHMTGMGSSRMTNTTTRNTTTTVGSANNTAARDNNANTVIGPGHGGSNSVPTPRRHRHNVPSAVISNNGQSPAGATTTGQ